MTLFFQRLANRVLLVALMLFCARTNATTLVQLTLEELVSGSELIFAGTVVDVTVSTEGDLVYSTVSFAVADVIKGETPDAVLQLRFLGGATDTLQTEVSGQYLPAVGERGLYFVDDTQRNLVNPLTGWSQGYFPLVDAADGVTYLDLKNHPVYGVLEEDADPLAGKMRDLDFTREQIAEKFPESLRFPLEDFIAVIGVLDAEQGN